MTKFQETALDSTSTENYNIPSFSQLEEVSSEVRPPIVMEPMTQEPQRTNLFGSTEPGVRDNDDYGRWVVVFGFSPGDYTSPIRALQHYGQITKHCPGAGGNSNFLFVQFASVMDRDHAVSLGATLLSENVLVSVTALTPELATRLHFADCLDGKMSSSGSGLRGPLSTLTSPNQRLPSKRINRPYSMGDIDGAIAQPPRRHVNFCKKVARALFGW
eukprot:CAMPEP_0114329228 /NCGR_PEP_ID=MMETSP0101-20121206/941_1 /TAXON_ID=38822 ORGANISM="Pteridomonas danica, Strain PT" /NCGR_SAMPLE_ID=MMETSP0101 /ASSEMBLY_ACC=CAM_ASM_000211 /LENGTH=215 /DNA_ID=CAMNT_0001458829 /DNA_START=220 /DNA_END=867 /DNA_ORIENTATION=-